MPEWSVSLISLLIGVGLGVISSFTGWWIVNRALRPKIWIAPDISKLPDDGQSASWRYRVKVYNLRRWWGLRTPAVDLHVAATLSVRGLRQSAPRVWYRINIPVGHTGELAYMKHNTALRLRIHEVASRQTALLPEELRRAIESGSIELERLLELGSKPARLRVVVTAAHGYTFGRDVAVWDFYARDVRCGPFETGTGGRVVENAEHCSERVPAAAVLESEDEAVFEA